MNFEPVAYVWNNRQCFWWLSNRTLHLLQKDIVNGIAKAKVAVAQLFYENDGEYIYIGAMDKNSDVDEEEGE